MKRTSFQVESSVVNQLESKNIRGVNLNVKLAAFDVPEKVDSEVNEKTGEITISFFYADDGEKLTQEQFDNENLKLTLMMGRKSRRLYRIIVDCARSLDQDVNELKFQLMLEQAENLLDDLSHSQRNLRAQSVEAIKNILHQYKGQMVPTFTAAM